MKFALENATITIQQLESRITFLMRDRCGKSSLQKSYDLSPLELTIVSTVNQIIQEQLWPIHKFLPDGWEHFRSNRDSVCQFILSKVQLDSNTSNHNSWEIIVKPAINRKYITLRSNFDNACRTEYICKCFRKLIIAILMSSHIIVSSLSYYSLMNLLHYSLKQV